MLITLKQERSLSDIFFSVYKHLDIGNFLQSFNGGEGDSVSDKLINRMDERPNFKLAIRDMFLKDSIKYQTYAIINNDSEYLIEEIGVDVKELKESEEYQIMLFKMFGYLIDVVGDFEYDYANIISMENDILKAFYLEIEEIEISSIKSISKQFKMVEKKLQKN